MTHCVPPRLSSVRASAQGVFAQQLAAGGRFMIVDRLGRVLYGSNLGEGLAIAAPAVAGPISTRIIPDRGLVISMSGPSGKTTASPFFPPRMLASHTRPTGFTPPSAEAVRPADGRSR